jgi:tRNA pseudouridine55 synthase
LASGLIVIAVGGATRLQELLMGHDKTYDGEIVLGATSATDDSEGAIQYTVPPPPRPSAEELDHVLQGFLGPVKQKPPAFSAIRVDGERLYRSAREGRRVEIPMRDVVFHSIDVQQFTYPQLKVSVRCGAGAYIRSLARDVGRALGHGGYLAGLRRTESGWFHVDQAQTPNAVETTHILTLEEAFAPYPSAEVSSDDLDRFLSGIAVEPANLSEGDAIERLAYSSGKLLARAVMIDGGLVRMRRLIRS